jgi:hypothetical protein
MQQYFVTGLILPVYMGTVFPAHVLAVCWCPYFPILDHSARNGMSNNMSHPKIAAPGDVLSTV